MRTHDLWQVGLAREEEAETILGLFITSFAADRRLWVPLGCPGALRYVQDTIARHGQGGDSAWVVARGHSVVGAAEIRRTRGALFLNHVMVRREFRGRGVARRLLSEAFLKLGRPEAKTICLDVFADNTLARTWYERLGFCYMTATRWESGILSTASGEGEWWVSGLAQADCVHARYGFSMLDLVTTTGQYHIGRLGSSLFRVEDPRLLADPDAAAALRSLGADRRLLLLKRPGPEPGAEDPALLAVGFRMSAPFEHTLRNLVTNAP